MAANLTRLPFIRGPCICVLKRKRLQMHLTDTFSFQHCLFTSRNVIPTSQVCETNVGQLLIVCFKKIETELSKMKQYIIFVVS